MAIFPGIMLVFYIALIAYFRSRGGYKAIVLATPGTEAKVPDAKFTGGVNAPMEAEPRKPKSRPISAILRVNS